MGAGSTSRSRTPPRIASKPVRRPGRPAYRPRRSARSWLTRVTPASTVPVACRCAPICSLPGHPEVFVIGDLMSLDHLPGLPEVALQSGRHAPRTIARRLEGDTTERPFRYRDLGTMATIARFRAVVSIGRVRVTGLASWLTWLVVHLVFLTGFKNRISALANWAVAFLGRGAEPAHDHRTGVAPSSARNPTISVCRRRRAARASASSLSERRMTPLSGISSRIGLRLGGSESRDGDAPRR